MHLRKPFRLAGAAVVSLSLLQVTFIGTSQAAPVNTASCDVVLPEAAPVVDVLEDGTKKEAALAEAAVDESLATPPRTSTATEANTLESALEDESLWLDRCGDTFYVEESLGGDHAGHDHADEAPGSDVTPGYSTAVAPLSETFNLNSRPGSDKTIYLDFRALDVTGSAWNNSYGSPIVSQPMSTDSDPAFSSSELTTIQNTWKLVADDFGAWDVNVTTAVPTAAQMEKSSNSDSIYGFRAMITGKNVIANQCGCGGLAYVGTNRPGTITTHSPAWVFAGSLGNNAKSIAEATSHEVGHNLGLGHDGTSTQGYYGGSNPWAPIMGVGYSQPVSQWSKGEYPDANNQQDDVAIIGTNFPRLPDSHPDSYTDPAVPSVAFSGSTTLTATNHGVITSGTDTDVLKLRAAGNTTVKVDPQGTQPNLDVGIRLRGEHGNVISTANPTVVANSRSSASGLNAQLTVDLPSTAADYFLEIYPVGHKTPGEAGGYSTYGSLGGWTSQITTQPGATVVDPPTDNPDQPLAPVNFSMASSYNMEVGKAFAVQLSATGGNGSYRWTATGLPSGVTLSSTGRLAGTPTKAVSTSLAVTATSAPGTSQVVSTTRTAATKVYARVAWKTGSALPSVKKGKSFTKNVYITGGKPSYKYSFSGRWPSGTKLYSYTNSSKTNFFLKGKPNRKGTYKFTAKVTDNLGMTASRTYTIKVK